MKDIILQKVSVFPPLDDTVNEVLAICDNPDSTVMDLTKVVEKDPMLTANILKSANSPLYGFSREIKSISHAISIFGMEMIKGFAFSSFLQKKPDLNLTPYNISPKDFSLISQKQNAFILRWYKGDKEALEALSLPSFLMEIGKIILSNIVIEHNKIKEFQNAINNCRNLDEIKNFEERVFGITNEEVAAMILEEWNFAPQMYNSIKYLIEPEKAEKNIQTFCASLKAVKSIITTSNFEINEAKEFSFKIIDEFGLKKDKFEYAYERFFELEEV